MIVLQACVMFDGSLQLECTGERLPQRATKEQVARSYSSGNPTVSIEHSCEWWKNNAPRAAEKMGL